VLTLILAVALVITSTRRVNTWDQTSVLLTAGVSLMVLAAALAIETLAEVERQTSAFGPASGVKTICFSVTVVGSQPSAGLASAWPGIVALLLAGPVLFVWSVLATNAPEPPSRKQATTDQRRT
jgi:hypothetical protein